MFRKLFAVIVAIAAPGAAHAAWYEASSAHFIVYSNDSPSTIQRFSDNLERFDQALRFFYHAPDPPLSPNNKLVVYVTGDIDDITKLAGRSNIAGFYRPRAEGSVAFVPRTTGERGAFAPIHVLLHEYAHHFMFSMYPNVAYPLWFSEGFAEFFSTAEFPKTGSVELGRPLDARAYTILSGNALPITKLLSADSIKLTDDQTEGLYARGWLLMHYLMMTDQRAGQLAAYIAAINSGKPPMEAAEAFGDLKQLDSELERYKTGRFAYYSVPADKLVVTTATLRPLTDGEAATMRVKILSRNGVDEKSAPGVYEQAKKVCAPFPDDPGAQMVLAEAAFDAGDYPESLKASARAIAIDPNRENAWVYKAMALLQTAIRAKDSSKPTLAAIHAAIGAANHLDTEDPEPLILYYRSYVEFGRAPPEIARQGMYKAFELAPQDPGLRMNVAQVYRMDRHPDYAIAMLRPLAFDPHNRGLAEAAAAMIKDIDDDAARKATAAKPEPKPAETPKTAEPAKPK